MAALVWLLIPLAAVAAAAIWGRWAARQRSSADGASLAGYERFRQAMQNSTPHVSDGQAAGHGSRASRSRVRIRAKVKAPKEPQRTGAPKEPQRPGAAKGPQRPGAGPADRRARATAAAGAAAEGTAAVSAEGEGDSPRGPVAGPVP